MTAVESQRDADSSKPLETVDVLREEAKAIHGVTARSVEGKSGTELYQELNRLDSAALCLSGGGIRSATFGLGVIEALAVNPRQARAANEGEKQSSSADKSLLRQFHYLSTVSGGGYIGSWLSAWIARVGYPEVWCKLIGRRAHPDEEPGETSWLRAYSNYLTPKLGLFSADTWTAVALYVRNLVLNWLVILPALVLLLLAIKVFAVTGFWSTAIVVGFGRYAVVAFVLVGVLLMMYALRFALLNRPSRFLGPVVSRRKTSPTASAKNAHRDEAANVSGGADEGTFVKHCLLPALFAAFLLALYLVIRGPKLLNWSLALLVGIAMGAGIVIYAAAWIWAWPPKHGRAGTSGMRSPNYWPRDFISWSIAGAVYGALIGLGVYILAHYDLWFLIGNINRPSPAGYFVPSGAGYFLIALIYGVPWIITAQLTAEMIFVGLTSWQPHSDADREWFGRSTGYFTVVALMWLAITFLVLIAAEVAWLFLKNYDSAKYASALAAVGSALFSTLVGKSGKSSATDQKDKSGLLMRIAVPLAAIVFLIMLVLAISYLLDYLIFGESLIYSSLLAAGPRSKIGEELIWLAASVVVFVIVAVVAWSHVNINRFSIHALYRNRLIRGYLGASNADREPNPFTGFDGGDNMPMAELWPPKPGSKWQPFQVVNIALNVVNSKRLAWQERKAESFTATPLHCGTAGLGYRLTSEYGNNDRGGLTLGTALAISGAAASPNMGYHSSPIVSLLLALFNVRLGWWLGNPGPNGSPDYYKSDGPRIAIQPFIAEMFGRTTDDRNYVYLSDGGHFENLGLYEMIRRRCRCIVISDAGCDPNYGFEDLGNAVRKIAIDLGVYISFGQLHQLKNRSKDNAVIEGAYYAIGEIDYKTAPEWNSGANPGQDNPENGYILYIKPGYHGTESAGVVAYATANATFPHETTGDQFFSESQFESYRTLGFEIMDGALREATENVETITHAQLRKNAKDLPLSPEKLCDLIKALKPATIKEAEDMLKEAENALKPAERTRRKPSTRPDLKL
jgi:hypothetical protein